MFQNPGDRGGRQSFADGNGGWLLNYTAGPSTAGVNIFQILTNGTQKFYVDAAGAVTSKAPYTQTASALAFGNGSAGIAFSGSSVFLNAAGNPNLCVSSNFINMSSGKSFGFVNGTADSGNADTIWSRGGVATWQSGAADAASPVAQTLQVQSVSAGTSNTAGADWTQKQSLSTGTGVAGNRVYQAGFALASAGANTVTMTIATPAVFTLSAHGFVTGTPVVFTTTGALPTGITSGTTYYVVSIAGSTSTFNVATSVANAIAGTLVATSGSQSGTHTVTTSATVQNPAITTATWGPSGLTGSQTTPLLDLKQTWNTSGKPTGINANFVGVTQAYPALFQNFQLSGSSKIAAGMYNATIPALWLDKSTPSTSNYTILINGGTCAFNTSSTFNFYINDGNPSLLTLLSGGAKIPSNFYYSWDSNVANTGGADLFLTRPAAATLQQGNADAASPVAQTLRVQSVSSGASNTAGQNWTIQGSRSTGSGTPGDIIFQTSGKGAASTTVNSYITALTIKGGTTNNTDSGYPSVVVGAGAALNTSATDGFLYIPTCAGAPAGTPTSFTGAAPIVLDTTNSKIYMYVGGAWKGVTIA